MNSKTMKSDPVRLALSKLLVQAFEILGHKDDELSQTLLGLLERPKEKEHGDLALPCFRFAKALKRKPDLIAGELKEEIAKLGSPWIAAIEVKGAFLNFRVQTSEVARQLLPSVLDGGYFKEAKASRSSERVMVEFSQPNTHKEFHVGHARNVCLGDALCQLFTYNGFELVAVNYIGDEGTHVAKCLWEVERSGKRPEDKSPTEWYGECYQRATQTLAEANEEEKKTFQKEISLILAELEAKSGPFYEQWQSTRKDCLQEFDSIYEWLKVRFDHVFYESELTEEAQAIVDEYLAKGLFKISEGAVGIDMEPYKLGFFMARKSDGTTLYMTKDLVLARRKFRDFQIDRSIYVVGSEQIFHFKQLFKALDLMGFEQAKDCFHLSYAHVTLPEGKMSSRAGNVVTFQFLKRLLLEELDGHLEKYRGEWTAEEISSTAEKLALGALRYGMLVTEPNKEIVFDPKAWTSFEGHSGPYLMYSYARTCSILRKCDESGYTLEQGDLTRLGSKVEHELINLIYDFNEVVFLACEHYKPSLVCTHLYSMCRGLNRFYAESPVLRAEDEQVRGARIALLRTFVKVLGNGLAILGIIPVDRM